MSDALEQKLEQEFYNGILVALSLVAAHDQSTIGVEIANAVGIDRLSAMAEEIGNEYDMDTIAWLNQNWPENDHDN